MKLIKYFIAAVAALTMVPAASARNAKSIITDCPEKAGGIYYAYDAEKDSLPPVPDGYTPVYISHYGRHGSRWPVNQKIYKITGDFFQQQQLAENITPEGKAVWKQVTLCAGNAYGHLGELTPMGERQHRGIAERMYKRFPALFADDAAVVARSSVEPRCIMSMGAFCDRLKELKPGLDIKKHASPGDMDFIHHNTPEAKMNTGEDAPWMWEFFQYRDSVSECSDVAARLFKKIPDSDSIPLFMRSLYDVAISVQDIDSLDVDILSIFGADELVGLWKTANFMQYNANGKSPLSIYSGTESVKPLLTEITERAEEMLESGRINVDLRFGHDTDLLRLVSLIDADGRGIEIEDPEEVAEKWRNFEISPMGGNLQLIFFRNKAGSVIVLPRLNETPVAISDVPQVFPGYYDWDLLKTYFATL
ncbi:MAG: histidine phosphatase family protein [Muribaculaceae bacterium]|nr:histidine phosphatase family protein [Muribaculaceae bacterium]